MKNFIYRLIEGVLMFLLMFCGGVLTVSSIIGVLLGVIWVVNRVAGYLPDGLAVALGVWMVVCVCFGFAAAMDPPGFLQEATEYD